MPIIQLTKLVFTAMVLRYFLKRSVLQNLSKVFQNSLNKMDLFPKKSELKSQKRQAVVKMLYVNFCLLGDCRQIIMDENPTNFWSNLCKNLQPR